MVDHEVLSVYPDIPSTSTPSRLARAVTSAGLCDGTKNPSALPGWARRLHPLIETTSTSTAAPIPPQRMRQPPTDVPVRGYRTRRRY